MVVLREWEICGKTSMAHAWLREYKAGRHLYIYVVVPVKQISLKSMREDLYDSWAAAFEVAQLPLKYAQTQYTE